jgi:multicomponent Na+:H+ antiporter subunit F
MTQSSLAVVGSVLLVALVVPFGLAAYRMVKGPAYADRFVAFDMMTAVVVAFAALITVVTGRSEFLDIGLGAALINFVATCALAAFLERKRL